MSTMNSDRPQPEYGCGMQDLYTVCDMVAVNYEQHVTRFEAQSTKYTAATGADLRLAIKNARMLPDEAQRDATHAVMRTQLIGLKDECLIVWQQMTGYIRDAFDKEEYATQINAAGHGYYATAQNEDWDDVEGLMQAGLNYLMLNGALLTTDGGMVAGFDTAFEAAASAFELKYDAFLQCMEQAKVDTDNKIVANNAIYKETMRICEDGKRIFRKEAAIREEFTFEAVLALVRSNKVKHGVSGLVMDGDSEEILGQVLLLLERLEADGTYKKIAETFSSNEGMYKFNGIAKGIYRLTASKVGFVAQAKRVKVEDGPVVVDFGMVSSE